jgi:hypothetical protein
VSNIDIFVPLLDDGVVVWRPARAASLGDNLFLILPVPVHDTERWQYAPGQVVRCSERAFADGFRGPAAIEAIPELLGSVERWIELHDSVLVATEGPAGETNLVLAAYVHRWEWRAGQRVGTGWKQGARLRLRAAVNPAVTFETGALNDGRIETHAATYVNMVPVPLHTAGVVHLRLQFSDGRVAEATASGFDIDLVGDPSFIEVLPADMDPRREPI